MEHSLKDLRDVLSAVEAGRPYLREEVAEMFERGKRTIDRWCRVGLFRHRGPVKSHEENVAVVLKAERPGYYPGDPSRTSRIMGSKLLEFARKAWDIEV